MVEIHDIFNVALSIIFILFLPGFALSFFLFPDNRKIDWIERLALSLGLSMATIPFIVFCLNVALSVKINSLNTFVTSLTLIGLSLMGFLERKTKFVSRRLLKRQVRQTLDKTE